MKLDRRTFYRFLNEGKAEMYRDAYHPDIDDYILNKIIEIDPMSNGDDVSEYGKLLMKLKPSQSDIKQVGEDIAIYAKAVENGADVPEMGDIKTIENLHYIAVDIINAKLHLNSDEMKSQEENFNCPLIFNDGGFKVLEINSDESAEYYGGGTMWPWAGKSSNGTMFAQFGQGGKIYVIINETDGSKYSVMKRGSRLRITNTDDELVDKSIFPQELISVINSINEGITDLFKQEDTDPMIEQVVNGILSAIHEKYNRQMLDSTLDNNPIRKSVSEICRSIDNENEIDGIVKEILLKKTKNALIGAKRFVDDSSVPGDKQEYITIKPEMFGQILSETAKELNNKEKEKNNTMVQEGFMDKIYDAGAAVKSKIKGTPEEAAATGDAITNSIINKLHELYPTAQQYAGKTLGGFKGALLQICLMVKQESIIDRVLRPVIQDEVDYILETFPMVNYRNRKACEELVIECFAGKGGLLYSRFDLFSAVKEALGIKDAVEEGVNKFSSKDVMNIINEAISNNIKKYTNTARKQKTIVENKRSEKVFITENELHEMIMSSIKKQLNENSLDLDRQWYEYVQEEKKKYQSLLNFLEKRGCKTAQLSEFRSGQPCIAINTDEYYELHVGMMTNDFVKGKREYISTHDYPATTYLVINKF